MSTKSWLGGVACVVVGFALGSQSQPRLIGEDKPKAAERVRWEYKVQKNVEGLVDVFNDLGDAGWELAWVDHGSAIFKRAK